VVWFVVVFVQPWFYAKMVWRCWVGVVAVGVVAVGVQLVWWVSVAVFVQQALRVFCESAWTVSEWR
jgi:hypothetical protein